MKSNSSLSVPRLKVSPGHDALISICGYGPSLKDTWQDVSNVVMSTSGAHDFLISKGIVPQFHVECDPRKHKLEFLRHPHKSVTYLINSQCHPEMFEALKGYNVVMWHGFTDDDARAQLELIESIEPGTRLLGGGTNVGMRGIIVAREMGFQRFELHGFDCCYTDTQWAGEHYTEPHQTVKIKVEEREFETSPMMLQSTDDFFNQMNLLSGCSFKIYGDGLLEARMQMFLRNQFKATRPGWWTPVNFVLERITKESLGMKLAV